MKLEAFARVFAGGALLTQALACQPRTAPSKKSALKPATEAPARPVAKSAPSAAPSASESSQASACTSAWPAPLALSALKACARERRAGPAPSTGRAVAGRRRRCAARRQTGPRLGRRPNHPDGWWQQRDAQCRADPLAQGTTWLARPPGEGAGREWRGLRDAPAALRAARKGHARSAHRGILGRLRGRTRDAAADDRQGNLAAVSHRRSSTDRRVFRAVQRRAAGGRSEFARAADRRARTRDRRSRRSRCSAAFRALPAYAALQARFHAEHPDREGAWDDHDARRNVSKLALPGHAELLVRERGDGLRVARASRPA